MQTRTVTGVVRRGNGQPWAGAVVQFHLEGTYTLAEELPPNRVDATTNDEGVFSASLFCNSEALTPARWRCVEPGSDPFFFTLTPGASITIGALRAAGDEEPAAPGSPAYALMESLVDDERAARVEADELTLAEAKAYTDEHAPTVDLSGYQVRSERNQPNGYAGLDSGGLIPDARIPNSIARDSEVTTAVAGEASARVAGDDAEASARATGDGALGARIDVVEATFAPLNSAALTGAPTAPTTATANSSTAIATTEFVHALAALILGAPPSTLDTIQEIAAALGNDPNFVTTITNLIGSKLSKVANLSDLTDPAAARLALSLVVGTHVQAYSAALASIAGLAPAEGDITQWVTGAWVNRTPAQFKTALALVKGDVGLSNVTNTSDTDKPVSTAQQAALDAKASVGALTAHTGDTANPHAVTKAQVGLGSVDNTSDAGKPISTATQAALDAKASAASLTAHTGDTTNPHAVTKAQVGLSNADNTSDANKPVSTAQQTALDAKASQTSLTSHTTNVANPHAVTKAQVGLSNVTNNPQLVSINGDTTQAQTVAGGDDISVATSGGATTVRRQAWTGGKAFWMFPYGNWYNATTGLITSANQVRVARLFLPLRLTVNSLHFHIVTTSAGGFCSVGIYSDDGNTLLIDSGAKSTTAAGLATTNLGAPVTLGPGWYWVAYTCDNATSAVTGAASSTNPSTVLNGGTAQAGAAANASAAGVLPATLGTVTASNVVGTPYVKVQN